MRCDMAVAARAYSPRISTQCWCGQGDRRYTLSSDLWAWQQYPVPQRGDLPPLMPSADEKAATEKATQERRQMSRELDRANLGKWGPLPERPPTDVSSASSLSPPAPPSKKVSDAALRQCLL